VPRQGIIIAQRYRLDNEVAAGATGRVWLAADVLLGRPVAVKVLRRDYARDPAILPRFLAAARQAAAVSHRSVAKVYDYGEGGRDDPPYVVTQFIEGPALPQVIRGEAVRASFIAAALAQVADGLHAAHQAGLVHGDLKPANILLQSEADRRATVTDFGITHALDAIPWAGHTPGTVHGTGTVLYLAPERVSGGLGTPASDLYSLGVIGYEWLTGVPPFSGNPQQVMAAHLRQPLPPLPAAVPAGLAELVTRLTGKDPASRLADASKAAAAARAVARELREDGQSDDASFPASPGQRPGRHVTSESATSQEAPSAVPRPAGEAAGPRPAELATHKREIAWAASALIVAGLIAWAPSGPIQSAVKIVQLAAPSAASQPPVARQAAIGRRHPGQADRRRSAAGDDGNSGPAAGDASRQEVPGGRPPGSGVSGPGGDPGLANADSASADGGRVAGSGVHGPSAGRVTGSARPCPCGPASPLSTPTSPAGPISHPAPSTGPQPPSAPASRPPSPTSAPPTSAPPTPAPPSSPLPVPTIPIRVPPIIVPPLPPLPLPLPPGILALPSLPLTAK
jgi:serine/threonine-protein kinase